MFSIIYCAIFAKRNIDILISHGDNNQISAITSDNVAQLEETKAML
jgi:hypothetical protein